MVKAKGPWGKKRMPQHPGVYVPGLASSQKCREVTAISPSQEWVRVPLPLCIAVKDEVESMRHGLCRITSPNPLSVRTARMCAVVWQGLMLCEGKRESHRDFIFSSPNKKGNKFQL